MISETKGPGVYIAAKAAPIVRDCSISGSHREGVIVTKRATGTIEGCTISNNGSAGVLIDEESAPTVRECRIFGNADAGIWVDENGYGEIEDCDITDNAEPGVRTTRGGNPALRRCVIHDGKGGGIVREDGGRGAIVDCTEKDNAPVARKQGAKAVLARQRRRDAANGLGEKVVFCTRHSEKNGQNTSYDGFYTEDDVRLYALICAVKEGTMSDDAAGTAWKEIYGQDLLKKDIQGELRFPSAADLFISKTTPGHGTFCARADRLKIPGAAIVRDELSPASKLAFEVRGAEALKRLHAAMHGRYKIVVWPDYSYLEAHNLEQANRMIKAARERDDGPTSNM